MDKKVLSELKSALAELEKGAKELKAQISSPGQDPNASPEDWRDKHRQLVDFLGNVVGTLHNRISSLADNMYAGDEYLHKRMDDHMKGHIPPIEGAGKMNKALKALGMDEDYACMKKTVYANKVGKNLYETLASKRGPILEVTLDLSKDKK